MFRLVDGADADAFVAADARFQAEVAYHQPGIARRTLARGDGGEWLVETLWWSAAQSDAAVHADESLAAFIDPATITVRRYEELPG